MYEFRVHQVATLCKCTINLLGREEKNGDFRVTKRRLPFSVKPLHATAPKQKLFFAVVTLKEFS